MPTEISARTTSRSIKRPIAGGEVRVSTVHDVDVLCANCHRMVHRREIPLTLKELRALIASQRARRKRA
jgi:predicted HNH restriction endonuclease